MKQIMPRSRHESNLTNVGLKKINIERKKSLTLVSVTYNRCLLHFKGLREDAKY